jgi:hypothetical protein
MADDEYLFEMAKQVGGLQGSLDGLVKEVGALRVENAADHGEIFRRLNTLNGKENRRQGVADLLRTVIPWCIAAGAIAVSYVVGTH